MIEMPVRLMAKRITVQLSHPGTSRLFFSVSCKLAFISTSCLLSANEVDGMRVPNLKQGI